MKLSGLAEALRGYGLTVIETPGWETRGFAGRDLVEVRGVLWHHTATRRRWFKDSNMPTLDTLINGRPGLAGPLSQIGLGRDGAVYLTAAGLANHAGYGDAPFIPRNQGNYYLAGVEMESSGRRPWDWTAAQKRVAPYLGAALELTYLMDKPPAQRLQLGHKEYAPGKIDPAGWPGDMHGLRAQINARIPELLNGSTALTEGKNDMDKARRLIRRLMGDVVDVPHNQGTAAHRKKNPTWTVKNALTNIWEGTNDAETFARRAARDSARSLVLVEQIAERAGMTADDIGAAVSEALERSTVDVDVNVKGK